MKHFLIMLTSYYARWSKCRMPGGISISRSQSNYSFPVYSMLAPGKWFRRVNSAEYCQRYQAQLDQLDPQTVWDELCKIAYDNAIRQWGRQEEQAQLVEPVLLCFEKPGTTENSFCHRRLAAQWFEENLSKTVDEGYIDRKGRHTVQNWDRAMMIDDAGKMVPIPPVGDQMPLLV